jgi:hypothetical protein
MTNGQILITHPDNKKFLDKALGPGSSGNPMSAHAAPLEGMPIQFDEYLPRRNISRVWLPPEPDRFVTYDADDEAWMRPLGLGRIVEIDNGPLFCLITAPEWPGRVAAKELQIALELVQKITQAMQLEIGRRYGLKTFEEET